MSGFKVEHLRKMKQGVQYFNEAKYWECHEELEDHWLDDLGDNARYVYWAVIQVATALYHYDNANLAGAQGMINKARDKFIKCEKYGVESDIMNRFLQWERFKTLTMKIPHVPQRKDFEELRNFKFSHPDKWDVHLVKMENRE